MRQLGALTFLTALLLAPPGSAAAAGPAAPRRVVVDESLSGQATSLDTSAVLVVRLPVIPATGYYWQVENPAEVAGVLRQLELSELGAGEPDIEYEGAPMPGAPVYQLLHFVGVKSGNADIRVSLRRRWEGGLRAASESMHFPVRSLGAFTGVLPQAHAMVKAAPPPDLAQVYAPGLPTHFDWRESNGVTPVKDQLQCGSCWAFGTTAMIESKIKIKKGIERDYSEQYFVSCNMEGYSCGGGWWPLDYAWMKSIPAEPGGGHRLEADFPYQGMDVDCNPPHTPYEQLEGWAYTDDVPDSGTPTVTHSPTVAQIKEKIYTYGPVGTTVCSTNWGSYTGGVFSGGSCTPSNHIVLITGWDDTQGVFYIKNSWGTTWGEAGYIQMPYGTSVVGENSTYVLLEKTNPRIRFRQDTFYEDQDNTGGIFNSVEARVEDATSNTNFAMSSGSYTQGTHYSVSNLPAGLTMTVTGTSSTTVRIAISGRATAHAKANSLSNVTITFLNAAFSGGSAAAVGDTTFSSLKVNFNDPYQVVYASVNGVWINSGNPWAFYWLDGSDYQYSFGLWDYGYNSAWPEDPNNYSLKLETYSKPALSTSKTLPPDLKNLAYGTLINAASQVWARGGSYGDQHTIAGAASKNSVFNGRTGYVGFSFERNGFPVYGWIQIEVDSSGANVRVIDYAWNQDPRAGIQAGYKTGDTCTYSINPTSASVAAAGGSGTVSVSTNSGCSWTAVSNASWITVTSGSSGSGSGTVGYSVAANTGSTSRTGTIAIAGQTFTVTQAAASVCTYSINPTSASIAAAGGTGSVSVTTTTGCAWTAVRNATWITVTSGSSGTGNGTVGYSVAANTGAARSGTITIAGRTFTVSQAGTGTCTYTINPTSATLGKSGGTGRQVTVTTTTGCKWTAVSNDSWITVTSGKSGTGSGTVRYSVAANSGATRTGTMTIAGLTFTVTQTGSSTCTYTINPTSASVAAAGGSGTVSVTTTTGCAWTAVGNATSWLTVTSGASGSGSGTVGYRAVANTGAARSGTITIAGQTFTLSQAAGTTCTAVPSSGQITKGTLYCVPAGSSTSAVAYMYIALGTSAGATVSVTTSGGTGNGNLYGDYATWPSTTSYSQASTGPTNSESIADTVPSGYYYYYLAVTGQQSGMTIRAE